MIASDFCARILLPAAAFAESINPRLADARAHLLLLAIAGQESAWTDRRQINGPARGFWQTEPNGVLAVLQNPATQRWLILAARAQSVGIDRASIYLAIEHNDPLAYAVARLLLWADPEPLPAAGDEDAAWATYLRCWRPGKPDRERWTLRYAEALAVASAESQPAPAGAGNMES